MDKKTIIIRFAVIFIVIIFSVNLWKLDMKDRTHPYGLDSKLNNKYVKKIVGEKYGVSVFWGIPSKKDTNKKHLDKIEWLSTSYNREVKWRRALVFGLITSLLILIGGNNFIVTSIFITGAIYFYDNYYDHHINYFKSKYIKSHVKSLKKNLNLNANNPIYKYI